MNLREKLQGRFYAHGDESFASFDERVNSFKPEMIRRVVEAGLTEKMAAYFVGIVMDSVDHGKASHKYTGIKKWTVKGDAPSACTHEFGYAYDILNELMRQLGHDIVPAGEKV